MFKKVIKKDIYTEINLEYDNGEYDVEYVKNKNMIILRRLKDNKVLEVFNDNIGFIAQYNEPQQINFLVSEYLREDDTVKLKHYVDTGFSDNLYLKNEFDCSSSLLSDCRVTNRSYLIEQNGYSGIIYNLNRKSRRFERIYNEEKINKILDDNVLLVTEKRYAYFNNSIQDTLTYGINPESFEIVTRIWSELQQRYIELYTQEELEKLKENIGENLQILSIENYKLGQITIQFEVQKYLDELETYLSAPKSVYLDSMQSKVNEEHIKKIIKK